MSMTYVNQPLNDIDEFAFAPVCRAGRKDSASLLLVASTTHDDSQSLSRERHTPLQSA
jgi:hypothetical protein